MKQLITGLCIVAHTAFATATAFAAGKPNIVLIMADDLGMGDLSYYVEEFMNQTPLYRTPAMDELAREGVWFTDGHSATALCSPTRYAVMSGNNNYRSYAPWGVWVTFAKTPFEPGEATLGSIVRDAGYTTGFVGKWHLGGDFKSADGKSVFRGWDHGARPEQVDMSRMIGGGPGSCGFDYSFTLPSGIQGPVYVAYENSAWSPLGKDSKIVFFNETTAKNPKDLSSKGPGPGDSNWDTREIGKLISAKADDFIRSKADKEPFFLYYCSPMAHLPHCPPETFDGIQVAGSTPTKHLDCVVDLDCQVARIISALKEGGVYENTLILFCSDNGGLNVSQQTGHKTSGPWNGTKNSPLEGGHRVPFFAVWPGIIKPETRCDELVVNTDMLATLAALVGTPVPETQARDSNNLLPLLTGKGTFTPREQILLQAGSNCEVIYRKDPWKLIIQSDDKLSQFEPIALYNLEEAPGEQPEDNQINHPERRPLIEQMLQEYLEIRRSGIRTVQPLNTKE